MIQSNIFSGYLKDFVNQTFLQLVSVNKMTTDDTETQTLIDIVTSFSDASPKELAWNWHLGQFCQ